MWIGVKPAADMPCDIGPVEDNLNTIIMNLLNSGKKKTIGIPNFRLIVKFFHKSIESNLFFTAPPSCVPTIMTLVRVC